jgi:RHS repeat-associated protein
MRPPFSYCDLPIRNLFSRLLAQIRKHRSTRRGDHSRARRTPGRPVRGRLLRTIVCQAIILNLLIWPSPRITFGALTDNVTNFAGTASSLAISAASAIRSLRSVPFVLIPSGPIIIPVPMLPIWPFTITARPITMADRIAQVAAITVSPNRMVGYIAETVTFVAMGADIRGDLVHGAKFTWESSDTSKLTIDEAGRATLVTAGTVIVTCRAGLVAKTAAVLIRPIRRPVQTDQEWRTDQESLVADARPTKDDGRPGFLASLVDKLVPTAHAQFNPWGDNPKAAGIIGTPPFAALEETRLGPVMPGSNFELPLPLVSLGGRGLATSLMLYYNSSVWGSWIDPSRNDATVYSFDPIQSWPSPGFSLGFGRVTFYDYSYYDGVGYGYRYMLIDPNGTRHQLGIGTVTGNNVLQTTDGSHITYVGDVMSGTLYFNDGTAVTIAKINNRLLPTQITDSNGNYIQIAYHWETNFPPMAINYIVDTLGRVIQFHYDAYNSTNVTSITTPTGTVSLGYQTVTMGTNFLSDNPIENEPASFSGISSVTIPQRPTCNFTYSGYGMIYNIVATSGGGTATVTYDYPQGGEQVLWPTFSHRTESPNAVYSYAADGITRPDGTKLILTGPDRELRNTSNATLSKTVSTLTTDPGGATALQSIITYDDATPTANQTKVDFDYDQYGNVVNRREYGYQISGAWRVRRRTHYTYVNWEPYLSAYTRNRQTEVDVYDALQNTNDADDVLISKTVYGYDGGALENYGGTANPPGHLASYDASVTLRGNLTVEVTYSDVTTGTSETRSQTRDIFGNTTKAQVSCCNEKTFYCDGHTNWARPCTETQGNPTDKCLTTVRTYDFNTLAVTSVTDANNQTTTYSYDAILRPTSTTYPNGANASTGYNAWGGETSSSLTYSEGGSNRTLTETAVYDGWGQKTSAVDINGAQTNYAYDAMGRLLTQTNPFPQGGTPGPVTTNQYDLLGRITIVTLPGGNTRQTTYNGSVQTLTDEVNRKTKRESDGLSRLIKVTEQDAAGALTQETTYTYDAADRLIGINQGNQTRAFKYDAIGHLLFERIPEQTATINDGSGTYWTTKYTYTDWGVVSTRQDARGVVTTYNYDTLHQLTSISYNIASAPGVAETPGVTWNYAYPGTCDTTAHTASGNTKGLLLSVGVGSFYSESYAYDSNKRVQAVTRTIDGGNYTTSVQYNTADRFTQIIYPSTRVINIGHDAKDRVTSVGTFLSSVIYNSIGQMTGTTLGNGVTEIFGYDANRMQLTSQKAGTVSPYTNRMNLTYSYDAAAGEMGAGTTAGNAAQLMAVSGTIGGTGFGTGGGGGGAATESANYTYDSVGRLVTSNQASNGQTAQRRFGYDRWGNRTGVWDAVSGGNQIQSVVLQQSGGAPTNQLTSVTNGGTTWNYSYDTAGNVTNDGSHSYIYDAENRLVSVDSGATAQYSYDHKNQRVKKTSGGTTVRYVWQDSHVIAEYNGGSNTLLAEYIYSGDRMVAKVESGTTNYFLSDPLGLRLMLDGGGSVVGKQGRLPFGEDFAETGIQEKHHFTTYERDIETGKDYAVNRIYSPNIGRFIQRDPYKGGCDSNNPQKLSRYSYVENDPMNKVDPLGLLSQSQFVCIIAPIFCESNTLPGGGPPPNPDGYSGWHLGFAGGGGFSSTTVLVEFKLIAAAIDPISGSTVCTYKACFKNPCYHTLIDIIRGKPCSPGKGVLYQVSGWWIFKWCELIHEKDLPHDPCVRGTV